MRTKEKALPASNAPSSEHPTRLRLLRAAERLFAERGVGATSTRAILREAGQRNESALQYHFGGREGLIAALYSERGAQVDEERETMLAALEQEGEVDIRRLCQVALMPAVRLARRQPDFALFLKAVGELAFLPSDELEQYRVRYELGSVEKVAQRIREQVDLPPAMITRRLELIHRMAALSLAQRARADQSFEGPEADLFFSTLLDAMAQILSGPLSPDTRACLHETPVSRSEGTNRP